MPLSSKKNTIKSALGNFTLYLIIFVIMEVLIFLFLHNQLKEEIELKTNDKLLQVTEALNSEIKSYKTFANEVFSEIINKPKLLSIINSAQNNKKGNQEKLKQILYNELLSSYRTIKIRNLKILNFYLKNGDRFLSFHDSISENHKSVNNRYSLTQINRDKQFIEGYEQSTTEIAYRFLYPLYFEHIYIGSVELAVPINCFFHDLDDNYSGGILVYVKKEIVPLIYKDNSNRTNNFTDCEFIDFFRYNYYENNMKTGSNYLSDTNLLKEINLNILNKWSGEAYDKEKPFNSLFQSDTLTLLTNVLPLKTINGEYNLMIYFLECGKFTDSTKRIFYRTNIVASFFLLLVTFLFYFFNRGRISAIKQKHLIESQADQLLMVNTKLTENHKSILLQNEELATQTDELESKKELLTAVNRELEKMSIIANETKSLVYIFNKKGELDWFNESFYKKIGYTLAEYVSLFGKSIVELSHNEKIAEYYDKCVNEKISVTYESSIKSKNAEDYWFHTTLTPVFEKNGELKMIVAIDADITELKNAEEKLEKQHKLTIFQRDEIIYQKKELTDSIVYAKRIQEAILPKPEQIKKFMKDSFVIYLPKDIVSGDFYWYHRIEDEHLLINVDCTGHGVPGAFMSIIGTYLLNNIVIQNKVSDPAEILRNLNRKLKISLKSENPDLQTHDGMDVAICKINMIKEELVFAGAIRPLFIFNNNDFREIKGDKNPITSSIANEMKNVYTNHVVPFKIGDVFYMFSDGLIDQFGGEEDKKFLSKRLKQLLIDINMLSIPEQRKIILNTFNSWKGDNYQVDDVLVIGVRNT